MRGRIAHGLMIAFLIVGLGAAQGPNNSEASSAQTRAVQGKPEVRKQTAKTHTVSSWDGFLVRRVFRRQANRQRRRLRYVRHDRRSPDASLGKLRASHQPAQWTGGRGQSKRPRSGRSRPYYRPLLRRRPGACSSRNRGLQRVRLDLVKPRTQRRQVYQTVASNYPVAELR